MDTRPASGLEGLVRALRGSLDVYDRLNEGVALYAPDGVVAFANATIFRLVGDEPGSAPTIDFTDYLADDEQGPFNIAFAGVLESGTEAEIETTLHHLDGAHVDVSLRLAAAHADGKIAGVLAIVTDISAENSAERLLLRSEQRFRSLFEHHPDPITIVSNTGTYKRINRAAEVLSGFLNEELVGKTNEGVVSPERLAELNVVREKTARGESAAFETTIVSKSGRRAELDGVAIPIMVDGVVDGFFSVTRDVTKERLRRDELATQSRRIHELYRVAASAGVQPQEQVKRAIALGAAQLGFDVACITQVGESEGTVVYSTGDAPTFTVGYTNNRDSSLARYALESRALFFVGDTNEAPWPGRPNHSAGFRSYVALPLIVGSEVYGTLSFAAIEPRAELSEPDRDYIAAIATLSASAIERDLQGQRLDALAFYDALTGLPNRVLLIDRITQLIAGARRYERSFAIHFIDLDRFKPINDTHGHAVGDQMLMAIGARLCEGLRDSDTLARFGGDEFILLQPEVGSPEGALELAKRVAARFAKPFDIAGQTFSMTISIGISMFPTDGADATALIASADAALYRVKEDGRDGIRMFDPSLAAKSGA
jgi:diguanylate cyclase (GGDEF)-like protein/PAS domain S-box-containing protein